MFFAGGCSADGAGRRLEGLVIAGMNEGEPSGYSAAQGELKAWLRAPGGKQAPSSGLTFAQMTTQVCRPVRLGGREVAEVCFKGGGHSFHFYARPIDAKSERKHGKTPTLVA